MPWTPVPLAGIHLEKYRNEGDAFLQYIVAIDKTWARAYNPELKLRSNEWHHRHFHTNFVRYPVGSRSFWLWIRNKLDEKSHHSYCYTGEASSEWALYQNFLGAVFQGIYNARRAAVNRPTLTYVAPTVDAVPWIQIPKTWMFVNILVPFRHMGTLNSRRALSPLVRGPWPPPGFSPSKLGWNRAKSYCHLHGAQS
ncbi:hypothetical protein TNCV_454321 [Trichonephila clavipes]|nr:hypothetical protein TNCV_454321 [Trichonephila clavipes]